MSNLGYRHWRSDCAPGRLSGCACTFTPVEDQCAHLTERWYPILLLHAGHMRMLPGKVYAAHLLM